MRDGEASERGPFLDTLSVLDADLARDERTKCQRSVFDMGKEPSRTNYRLY